MVMHLKRKETEPHMVLEERNIPVLTFPALSGIEGIRHCYTTREGGVSEGYLSSLNLKMGLGDSDENVIENFRRVAEAMQVSAGDFVLSDQTHTDTVRCVTEEDRGKGLVRRRDYQNVDALVTNVRGLVLCIVTADCVPLYFVDPVRRAVGLAHSGWRGTVKRIGARTIERMTEEYGTNPADLICAVGPSICRDCYEVSGDVAGAFRQEFAGHEREILTPGRAEIFDDGRKGQHFQLDLWEANRIVLEEAGVMPGHISVTDICTCCNRDLMFSHRGSHGRRGVMGAFLGLC